MTVPSTELLDDPLLTSVPVTTGYKVLGGGALAIVLSICACLQTEKPEPLNSPSPELTNPTANKEPAPAKPEQVKPPSRKASELKPDEADAYHQLGLTKALSRDHTGAIADFTKVIELKPDYADAYYNRGNAKIKSRDYKGAMADYNRTIEINPDDELAKRNLRLVREKLQKQGFCFAISIYAF